MRYGKVVGWALFLAVACAITVSGASADLKMSMWINEVSEIEATEAILDTYMAANPGVQLELMQQHWNGYHEKLVTLAAGGVAPDVMVISRSYLPSFAHSGVIRPIGQWLAQEKFDLKRDVTEMASGTWNGNPYGIPIWGGPYVMIYNKDMFEEIGLASPTQLAQSNQWTWDNLIELGKKVSRDTSGDGVKDAFMLPAPAAMDAVWYAPVRAYGGDVMRDNRAVIDAPEAQRGLQLLSDIRWAHHIAPQPGEGASFANATLAIDYTWVSDAPNFATHFGRDVRSDLVTVPTGSAGAFHVAGGCPVTVSAGTAYPEEAYKLAVWFAMESDEWKLRGIPASMKTIRRDYRTYLAQFFASPDVVVQALSGPTGMEPSIHLYGNQLRQGWNPLLESLFAGRISAMDATEQIARHINAVLESN